MTREKSIEAVTCFSAVWLHLFVLSRSNYEVEVVQVNYLNHSDEETEEFMKSKRGMSPGVKWNKRLDSLIAFKVSLLN